MSKQSEAVLEENLVKQRARRHQRVQKSTSSKDVCVDMGKKLEKLLIK